MKRNVILLSVAAMLMMASCAKDQVPGGTMGDKVEVELKGVGFAFSPTSKSPTSADASSAGIQTKDYPTTGTRYNSADALRAAGTDAYASYYIRTDGHTPDDTNFTWVGLPANRYIPVSQVISRHIDPSKMGADLYVTDATGADVAECLIDPPTLEDYRPYIGNNNIYFNGEVIYRGSTSTDENWADFTSHHKILWYVAKYQHGAGGDDMVHVDGIVVPNEVGSSAVDYQDVVIDLVLDRDLLIQFDDFDIRCSGSDAYMAGAESVSGNTLTYNQLTFSRDDNMQLRITGLNKLDWSGDKVWTFESWMWAVNLPESEYSSWQLDQTSFIHDNPLYDVEYHIYKGFESNGTVPYVKVSIHVSKKPQLDN